MRTNYSNHEESRRQFLLETLPCAALGTGGLAYFASGRDALAAPSVAQKIIVISKSTKKPVQGATVGVYDNIACYAPLTSDSTGSVTVNTSGGIQTILVRAKGYLDYCQSPNSSGATYNVELADAPDLKNIKGNTLLATAKAVASDVKKLFLLIALPKSLGRCKLKDIEMVVKGVSITAGAVCLAFPPQAGALGPDACKIAAVVALAKESMEWLAEDVLKVSKEQEFEIYMTQFPVVTLLIIPVSSKK